MGPVNQWGSRDQPNACKWLDARTTAMEVRAIVYLTDYKSCVSLVGRVCSSGVDLAMCLENHHAPAM